MITTKTGSRLTVIEMPAHLIASDVLADEMKENKKISARHNRNGFSMFEVRLAILFFVLL